MEEENHQQLLSTQIHRAENDWKLGEQYLRKRAYIFALFLLLARLVILPSVGARILFQMDF